VSANEQPTPLQFFCFDLHLFNLSNTGHLAAFFCCFLKLLFSLSDIGYVFFSACFGPRVEVINCYEILKHTYSVAGSVFDSSTFKLFSPLPSFLSNSFCLLLVFLLLILVLQVNEVLHPIV